MSARARRRRERRRELLAADAARRLSPPRELPSYVRLERLSPSRANRRAVADGLAGVRRTVPEGPMPRRGAGGGLSAGSPFTSAATPVQPAPPPHPMCRSAPFRLDANGDVAFVTDDPVSTRPPSPAAQEAVRRWFQEVKNPPRDGPGPPRANLKERLRARGVRDVFRKLRLEPKTSARRR